MTKRLSIIFVVLGIIIGVFFAAQFRTDVPLDSAFPADQYVARQNLIKDYVDEQGVLRNQIANLNRQIDEQQKKNQATLSTAKLSYLDELKANAGLTPVIGPGIEINLSDSPGTNREGSNVSPEAIVQAADIRDIINLLRTGHPNGISVNGQRIIATTPITAVGGNILVNNSYIAPPFIITVSGDDDFLYQRLKDPTVLAELKRRASTFKLQFSLTLRPHVNIPSYNGDFRLKYVAS